MPPAEPPAPHGLNGSSSDDPEDGRPQSTRGEQTRAAMLAAATQRLNEATMQDFLTFLRPEDIAAAAGRSKAAFFHHWPNQAAFLTELVASDPTRTSLAVAGASDFFDALEPSDVGNWVSRMRSASMAGFDALTSNPRLAFGFLGPACGDPVEHERLRMRHEEVDRLLVSLADKHLPVTHLRVREPFTVTSLAVAVHSLAFGLAARARTNPEGATAVLFSDILTALLPAVLTNVSADGLPLDEFIDNVMASSSVQNDGSVALTFTPDPVRVDTATQAGAVYGTDIVPRLAAALDEAIDAQASLAGGDQIVREHLERLAHFAHQEQGATLALIGLSASRALTDAKDEVPDILAETGLLAVTRRALLTLGPTPRSKVDALAKSAISAMLRSGVGFEPVEVPVLITGVLAMLHASAGDGA